MLRETRLRRRLAAGESKFADPATSMMTRSLRGTFCEATVGTSFRLHINSHAYEDIGNRLEIPVANKFHLDNQDKKSSSSPRSRQNFGNLLRQKSRGQSKKESTKLLVCLKGSRRHCTTAPSPFTCTHTKKGR